MSEKYTLMRLPARLVETVQEIVHGSMVAVPKEHLDDIDAFLKHGVISDIGGAAYSRARVAHRARMLAAVKDARHD